MLWRWNDEDTPPSWPTYWPNSGKPDPSAHTLAAETMTASEQMFFLGAPLAHVVDYEEALREDRLRRSVNVRQARRIIQQEAA